MNDDKIFSILIVVSVLLLIAIIIWGIVTGGIYK